MKRTEREYLKAFKGLSTFVQLCLTSLTFSFQLCNSPLQDKSSSCLSQCSTYFHLQLGWRVAGFAQQQGEWKEKKNT